MARREPTAAPAALVAVQRSLHEVLRGEVPAEVGAADLAVSPRSLALYRDFVRGHVDDVLTKQYPLLPELLGAPRWRRLRARYFREHPADHPELNRAAAALPEFLDALVESGEEELTGLHADLARLDRAEWQAHVDPSRIPPPQELSAPTLNPTLRVQEVSWPAVSFLLAWRRSPADARPSPPEVPGSELALVLRDPTDDRVHLLVADDRRLFAFKVAHDGLGLGEAARAAGVTVETAERLVEQAAREGLVLLPAAGCARHRSRHATPAGC